MRWGRDCCRRVSLRELRRSSRVLELWTVNMSRYLTLEFDGKNWCWPVKAHVNNRKVLKTLIWQKEKKRKKVWHHYMNSCCQTRTMERKSQLKTIKSTSIFQLVWFPLVALVFASVTVLMTRNWWTTRSGERTCGTGDSSTPMRPYRGRSDSIVAPCHLWPPPSVWDQ